MIPRGRFLSTMTTADFAVNGSPAGAKQPEILFTTFPRMRPQLSTRTSQQRTLKLPFNSSCLMVPDSLARRQCWRSPRRTALPPDCPKPLITDFRFSERLLNPAILSLPRTGSSFQRSPVSFGEKRLFIPHSLSPTRSSFACLRLCS